MPTDRNLCAVAGAWMSGVAAALAIVATIAGEDRLRARAVIRTIEEGLVDTEPPDSGGD